MPGITYWRGDKSIEREFPYRCRSCGFEAKVWAKGRGFATALSPNRRLSDRAHDAAIQNALMRIELKPCPRCGKRCYETWGGSFRIAAVVLFLVFGPGVGAWTWFQDSYDFEAHLATYLVVLGAFVVVIELMVTAVMLWELRAANIHVRFLE